MKSGFGVLGLALCAGLAGGVWAQDAGDVPPAGYDVGMIRGAHVFRPDGAPKGVVFLISDAGGWGAADQAEAAALQGRGVAVVGLDLPGYLAALEDPDADSDCSYAVADIEELSKRLQSGDGGDYRLPLVAGRGAGGGLAVALAAQTPASTLAGIVAVDPTAGIALKEPLCTEAPRSVVDGQTVYGLMPSELNVPVDVTFTVGGTQDARDHLAALAKDYPGVTLNTADGQGDPLARAIDDRLRQIIQDEGPLNLPLTEMPVDKPGRDTLAIIYSGDGGWRDIDRQVGETLQQDGVPVVGVDSLRYFWNERKPQETADDLARIIAHYRAVWGVKHVVLVGYSFGADILPESYDLLPPDAKASIVQMTLMGLSHERDYVIHVTGWLGMPSGSGNDPTEDLRKVPAPLVQCIFGAGDDEDACHELTDRGYEMVPMQGGHHFDGNYEDLARRILGGLDRRL